MNGAAEIEGLSHRFVEANGLRFHVAECGTGERLALCLHGFPELGYSWRHQMPLLARLGYRVWAPDLRGYGQSERPPRRRDYDIEILMDDVAGLIDASGARQTLLIAHDWGGVIGWLFAIRRLRPLERLVMMNIPHPVPFLRALRTAKQLRSSWYVLFFQLPWLPEKLLGARGAQAIGDMLRRTSCHPERLSDEDLEVFRKAAAQPGALTAMLNYYRMLVRGPGARRQHALGYPVIDTPTLMIWGEEDVALSKETTHGTERYVADLTLRYLPGVSHWVQQDDPEAVNAILEAWLSGQPLP
ncbi:MAG: alpha/beta hydrolase [Deltaproteobacteria bacterium]|nr:alpha/beta hydrolase [Deltaproteobacteria bacterium]